MVRCWGLGRNSAVRRRRSTNYSPASHNLTHKTKRLDNRWGRGNTWKWLWLDSIRLGLLLRITISTATATVVVLSNVLTLQFWSISFRESPIVSHWVFSFRAVLERKFANRYCLFVFARPPLVVSSFQCAAGQTDLSSRSTAADAEERLIGQQLYSSSK